MKPNFALSLSFDGLRLMHRAPSGWHLVGQVALDDADLNGALGRLRAAASDLEPGGISTKLLIPNDQIKYLALDTTRAEDGDVWAALDGATPYAVQDLAYDYAKGGGRTYVAAVAKETLAEAEQFATEHGFNPTSFAAVPEPFTYVGEALPAKWLNLKHLLKTTHNLTTLGPNLRRKLQHPRVTLLLNPKSKLRSTPNRQRQSPHPLTTHRRTQA